MGCVLMLRMRGFFGVAIRMMSMSLPTRPARGVCPLICRWETDTAGGRRRRVKGIEEGWIRFIVRREELVSLR